MKTIERVTVITGLVFTPALTAIAPDLTALFYAQRNDLSWSLELGELFLAAIKNAPFPVRMELYGICALLTSREPEWCKMIFGKKSHPAFTADEAEKAFTVTNARFCKKLSVIKPIPPKYARLVAEFKAFADARYYPTKVSVKKLGNAALKLLSTREFFAQNSVDDLEEIVRLCELILGKPLFLPATAGNRGNPPS